MQQTDFQIGEYFPAQLAIHFDRGLQFALFVLGDDGVDHIDLMSLSDLFTHEVPYFIRPVLGDSAGDDGRASGREFVKNTEIEIAVESKGEGAWDGGGGHDQKV